MATGRSFTPAVTKYLRELADHNNRGWFEANKPRYLSEVRDPALQFIADFAPHLKKISPHFRADPRPVGGSLFRIYRDTRFSKDKSPYKTHVGIQFRHERARDVHAPGFYLHLEPGAHFAGVGIWHPEGEAVRLIREAIVEDPAGWKRAAHGQRFRERFDLQGDALKQPPKGFDPDHPLLEDLKRKDFIGGCRLTQKVVTGPGFVEEFAATCRDAAPFMRYLCGALGLEF
jgi:uncharacterized protein (TIGR02453 family)